MRTRLILTLKCTLLGKNRLKHTQLCKFLVLDTTLCFFLLRKKVRSNQENQNRQKSKKFWLKKLCRYCSPCIKSVLQWNSRFDRIQRLYAKLLNIYSIKDASRCSENRKSLQGKAWMKNVKMILIQNNVPTTTVSLCSTIPS